jgi:hypothetical protein
MIESNTKFHSGNIIYKGRDILGKNSRPRAVLRPSQALDKNITLGPLEKKMIGNLL